MSREVPGSESEVGPYVALSVRWVLEDVMRSRIRIHTNAEGGGNNADAGEGRRLRDEDGSTTIDIVEEQSDIRDEAWMIGW